MNRPKVEEKSTVYPIRSDELSGTTGVARYLESIKKVEPFVENIRLLDDKKETTSPSSVTRYLERHQVIVTGVTRYALKQAIAEKNAKKCQGHAPSTGVDKYLKSQKPTPTLSGVAKYLKKQDNLPPLSKVTKYLARQSLVEKQSKQLRVPAEKTGVSKYVDNLESLPKSSRVSRYVAKQALVSKKQKTAIVETRESGVAKYIKNQQSMPQSTRVARYLVRQTIANKQREVIALTGVDRYMRSQV
jgi:hypothetical protein